MEKEIIKLNLGCGQFKKEGYLNIDTDSSIKPDILHNLEKFPYPFADNSIDLIEADHILEHFHDVLAVMREIWRILKPEGKLVIRVPHFSRGFTHVDHKRGFDISFPYYFNPQFKGGYTGIPFVLERQRFRWFAQLYLKKTALPAKFYYPALMAGKIIDFFANLSPFFCSRVWCYWVGGFEEVEFIFVKKQP